MTCTEHVAYMVPGCDTCVSAGYERQLLDDQRDILKALNLMGIPFKTIRFLESLGNWALEFKKTFSNAQRASLEKILEDGGV